MVTRLGTLQVIDDQVMGGLWATDLSFLQDLYRRINTEGTTVAEVSCTSSGETMLVDVGGGAPGE